MLPTLINNKLVERQLNSNLRALRSMSDIRANEITIDGNKLINFTSNDYLSLSQHPLLKERAIQAIEKYGVGNPSSRLLAGNSELYCQIETQLAQLKGTETAIIFPTGFQTNLTALHALSKLNSFNLCDKLSHNSAILGAQLNTHRFKRFAHNDLEDLTRLILKHGDDNVLVFTESVFSMDGDIAPIKTIQELCQTSKSFLYVDEAHATGLFGKNGMGLVESPQENTLVMGTFGKGCGSFGAYIACSNQLRDYLVNFCSGLIYTTALPPPVLASIYAALELIPQMAPERDRLQKLATRIRDELRNIGFQTGQSVSPIISLYLGSSDLALSLSAYLENRNIYARAIRPPTVPDNTARIRLSVTLAHTDSDIDYLITVLNDWHANKH